MASAQLTELGFEIVKCGDYQAALWLQTAGEIPAPIWDESLQKLSAVIEQLNGDVSQIRFLSVTDGGAPSAMQRRQLFSDMLQGRGIAASVSTVLQNPVKRGIATAILWINPNFRAFAPEQYRLALKHLSLLEHEAQVLASLKEIQRRVKPVASLEIMLKTAG